MTTRKHSESAIREALNAIGEDIELVAFKPQDLPGPAGQKKPADFLVWYENVHADYESQTPRSCWLEVKAAAGKTTLPLSTFTPSQLASMREAARVGLPYLVAVHWPKLRTWTIGPASIVLARTEARSSIPIGAWPINCAPGQLAPHLRAALEGDY